MNDSTITDLTAEAEAVFTEQSALVRGSTHPMVKAALGTEVGSVEQQHAADGAARRR